MRIRELIKEKGYTQQEFADILGITRVGLAHLISGKPSYTTLERIAEVLQVPVWQLLVAPGDVQGDDFCAFVRYKGKHYTADNVAEFLKIVETVKADTK
jgi:transcriptional regulator with XRE-family HTH domain